MSQQSIETFPRVLRMAMAATKPDQKQGMKMNASTTKPKPLR